MRNRNGFTLIELLVVITIIAVLAGLLIPGVMRAMKQAKGNRALSEMQHLATVISQVYSEVGYYVRLEDLAKQSATGTSATPASWVWLWKGANYANGLSDDESFTTYADTALLYQETGTMWNGPYTTYKNYVSLANYGSRPIDPWGIPTGSDTLHQYRMFVITNYTGTEPAAAFVPSGATAAMVIISAGGDGKYQCGITPNKTPADAVQADFNNFNPALDKGDDFYYIFNAGIQ